jgi:hypothetical protein
MAQKRTKKKLDRVITTAIDSDIYDFLDKLSQMEERAMSNTVRTILKEYHEKNKDKVLF